MAALSNYLENALLNAVLRNVSYTSPAAVYIALFTADPTDAGLTVEVSGGSYARQAISFSAPSGGATQNSGIITFPTATADWGTVSHFGILDASTSGNLLFHAALTVPKLVENTQIVQISAGDIDVALL